MADVTVIDVQEMETMRPGADGQMESTTGGKYGFRLARPGLGASAFGINVIDMPPNYEGHPDHDHARDGQEEVYIVLAGSATLLADDEEHLLKPGVFARVGAEQKRKINPGDEGVRLLVVGGTPGSAYQA